MKQSKEVARARPKTLDDHLRSATRKVIRAVKSGRGCTLTHYEAVALDKQQADGDWWMKMRQQVARDEIEAIGPI
jgi:ribosomal protein L13E